MHQEIKRTYMTNKNFEPKVVAYASQAAEGLCKWIRAMVLYDQVAKIVAPKKTKLAAAEHDYNNTLTFLRERQQMLAELNKKLDILRENLHEIMTKKIRLENEVSIFLLFHLIFSVIFPFPLSFFSFFSFSLLSLSCFLLIFSLSFFLSLFFSFVSIPLLFFLSKIFVLIGMCGITFLLQLYFIIIYKFPLLCHWKHNVI